MAGVMEYLELALVSDDYSSSLGELSDTKLAIDAGSSAVTAAVTVAPIPLAVLAPLSSHGGTAIVPSAEPLGQTLSLVPLQQHKQQPLPHDVLAQQQVSGNPKDQVARVREMKKQKERFLIFTHVLLKYLETKNPPLHAEVKNIIKDCAERNKRQERGYESVTRSMRTRLKEVVDEKYWKRAEQYLEHFLKQKGKRGRAPL